MQKTLFKLTRLLSCLLITITILGTQPSRASSLPPLQDHVVTGKITSTEDGQGFPGANIVVKGTTIGTTSDADGKYTLTVPSSESILIYSAIGYTTEERTVGTQTQINISMTTDITTLSEVVVVGYGTQKKVDITTSVATFNTEQIKERPLQRVDQALVGQMAGVRVKQTSGIPGKGFTIQVRGTGSITANAEPLYVIDGFPLEPASQNSSGGFNQGNPMDNINPNDIESIQVLKDAAAAAIYGSRASNGVIIIKTKSGQVGKAKISFSAYTGISQVVKKLDVLNGPEWIDRAIETTNYQYLTKYGKYGATAADDNETRRTLMASVPLVDRNIIPAGKYDLNTMSDPRWAQIDPAHPNEAPTGLQYVDWQDEIFRKGVIQNYEVSASGGTEAAKYFVSGGYLDNQGTAIGLGYKRYSGRANVEIKANEKLKFGLNISPTYSITKDPGVEGKDQQLHIAVSQVPIVEANVGPANNNVGPNPPYAFAQTRNSPLAVIKNSIGDTKSFRTLSTIFAEYQIIKDLNFRTSINFDNVDGSLKRWTPAMVTGSGPTARATTGSYTTSRRQNFVNENTLSYNKIIGDNHNLSLLVGQSYNLFKYDAMTVNGTAFTSDVITTLNAATAFSVNNGSNPIETKNVLLSYFGRAQYSLKDRYLLSASVRRDGSSRFGNNTKWGYFPSASIGWRISQENFMQEIGNTISELKLRGSWGVAGNNNIGDYSSISILQFSNTSFGGNAGALARGLTPQTDPSPTLGWEKSTTIDVGLDFGLIQNRVSGSFDYFTKNNTDLLLNVPVLAISGYTTKLSNIGRVLNKGWEAELHTRNTVGTFQWSTDINFSHITNVVKKLGPEGTPIYSNGGADIDHTITTIGHPIQSLFLVQQVGLLSQADIDTGHPLYNTQEAGDPKYRDASGPNGVPDGVIDANDRVIMGGPNPTYTWGITNTFRFKGFDLNVLIQGQNGGYIYSMYGRAIDRTGQGATDNSLGKYRNRWRSAEDPGSGDIHKWPSTFGRIKNTDWLYSSDYVRVRNITLGYDLKYLLKGKVVNVARIYATAENWFGHDKYYGGFNPEGVNTSGEDYGAYPLAKSIIFGINVTF